jgi:arginase
MLRLPVLLIVILLFYGCQPASEQARVPVVIENPPPQVTLFAQDLFSTHRNELNASFSPDGNVFLYTIANNSYSDTFYTIFVSHFEDGAWSSPRIAPFSGRYSDADPFFAPDGKRVYFISKRPCQEKAAPKSDFDIWFVDVSSTGELGTLPHPLTEINSDTDELYPSVAMNGNLYYSTENDTTGYDILVSRPTPTGFSQPESISPLINTNATEYDAYIAPDESYLIFTAMGRTDGMGSGDLYISKKVNNQWTVARNLGPAINSPFMDQCPWMSPDGKSFFFTSFRDQNAYLFTNAVTTQRYLNLLDSPWNGLGNVFWVHSQSIFQPMKPIAILEFPTNLGLAMPRPNHEPGVKQLPGWLASHQFHAQIKPVLTQRVAPPPYGNRVDSATGVRNTEEIIRYVSVQESALQKTLADGYFPIVLGGDCSVVIGNMVALKKMGSYGLFSLDGHTDFMLPSLSSTAGAAGMDLAIVTGYGHDKLTDIENLKPYVPEQWVWSVGNREYDEVYVKPILNTGFGYYDLKRLRGEGIRNCVDAFLKMVDTQSLDGFWIHIDLDVLDDAVMPAVDSRSPDGLRYSEFAEVLKPLLLHPKVTGCDLTILDPELDATGQYTQEFVSVFTKLINTTRKQTGK